LDTAGDDPTAAPVAPVKPTVNRATVAVVIVVSAGWEPVWVASNRKDDQDGAVVTGGLGVVVQATATTAITKTAQSLLTDGGPGLAVLLLITTPASRPRAKPRPYLQ
jgi:hypothetical protein